MFSNFQFSILNLTTINGHNKNYMKVKIFNIIAAICLLSASTLNAQQNNAAVRLTVNGENQPVVFGLGRKAGLCKWEGDTCQLTDQRSAVSPQGTISFRLPDDEGEYSVQIALNGSQTPIYSPRLKPGMNEWDVRAAILNLKDAGGQPMPEGKIVRLYIKDNAYKPYPYETATFTDGRAFVYLPSEDKTYMAGYFVPGAGVVYSAALEPGEQTWPIDADAALENVASIDELTIVPEASALTAVWVNNGEDKVTRDELRASNGDDVRNMVWDGETIKVFAAKNEVVAFNVVLEAGADAVDGVSVQFDVLEHSNGARIISRSIGNDDYFNFVGRPIELFYVRYLEIKGLSQLAYNPKYDERHVPERLRLPFSGPKARSKGKWEERPDANAFYPDIAVPFEKVRRFTIAQRNNQSIWVDITVPEDAAEGVYKGHFYVLEKGQPTHKIPVELNVLPFALPDRQTAPTMVYFSQEDVHDRYIGKKWPNYGALDSAGKNRIDTIWRNHHKLAQRHKISLIDDGLNQPRDIHRKWHSILTGDLFTQKYGYDGPGEGVWNGVYSIGTYGGWRRDWKQKIKEDMWRRSDGWVKFFEKSYPNTEYFLYLLDEPRHKDFPKVEQWAQWIDENPGPGSRLPTLTTAKLLEVDQHMPSVDIAFTWWGDKEKYAPIAMKYLRDDKPYWAYNGHRPWAGSYAIEDDGVAMRTWGWIQHKHSIARWFYWQATAYKNPSHVNVETNVFERAWTFGREGGWHDKYGKTGSDYNNGDGVLFYPGTEKRYKKENYGLDGPIASLRLKHWRRGLQDHDYLAMAAEIDPERVRAIVQRIIPRVLWEVDVTDPNDPSYVHADISWSTDPDVWEKARLELAEIIIKGQ